MSNKNRLRITQTYTKPNTIQFQLKMEPILLNCLVSWVGRYFWWTKKGMKWWSVEKEYPDWWWTIPSRRTRRKRRKRIAVRIDIKDFFNLLFEIRLLPTLKTNFWIWERINLLYQQEFIIFCLFSLGLVRINFKCRKKNWLVLDYKLMWGSNLLYN